MSDNDTNAEPGSDEGRASELDGSDFYRGGVAASSSDGPTVETVDGSQTMELSPESDARSETESEVESEAEPEDSYGVLSIVVPAYNEADTIEDTVERIDEQVRTRFGAFEIVVVNDGSDDGTGRVVETLQIARADVRTVSYSRNRGKGYALKQGCEEASGDYVLFLDADSELDPERLERFVDTMESEDADIVIGSKRHPDSDVDYPLSRRVLSKGYSLMIAALFRLHVTDTQVGMKLFRKEVVDDVMPLVLVKEYAFDVEMLVLGEKFGYDIVEAPVDLEFSGGSSVDWKAIARIAWDTAAVFYRLRILRYYDRVKEEHEQPTIDGETHEA